MYISGEFTALLFTCLQASFTFALLCVPGAICGYSGTFSKDFIGTLAKLNMNFLMPCMILGNIGRRLQMDKIDELWPLLTWSCMQLLLGLVIATAVYRLVEACSAKWCGERSLQPLSNTMMKVLPCVATLQNCVAFGLPIMETMCQAAFAPTGIDAGECFDDAVLYIFVYSIAWQIVLWTILYSLFQSAASDLKGYSAAHAVENVAISKVPEPMRVGASSEKVASAALQIAEAVDPEAQDSTASSTDLQHVHVEFQGFADPASSAWRRRCSHCGSCGRCCRSLFRCSANLVNPALVGLFVSVLVAAVPPLQVALFDGQGPLRSMGDAIQKLGNVVPVLATLLVSASLGRALRAMRDKQKNGDEKELAEQDPHSVPRWAGLLLIFLRLLFLPVLGLAVMLLVEPLFAGLIPPIMRAVIVLNWASPAANNSVVLCQRMGLGSLAESLAAMYVPMYVLCLFTVPTYVSVGMYFF